MRLHRPLPRERRRQASPPLKRLASLTDPSGQDTGLHYDAEGNVTSLRTPDGAISRWSYDQLGRCTAAIDQRATCSSASTMRWGGSRVLEPDGNVRQLEYDAEGNVVRARDQQHDVRFTYQGMGRLSSRTEAGTPSASSTTPRSGWSRSRTSTATSTSSSSTPRAVSRSRAASTASGASTRATRPVA